MKYIKVGIIVIVSLLIVAGGIGYYLYHKITTPNNCKETYTLYIDENTTLETVCNKLSKSSNENTAYWVEKIFEVKKGKLTDILATTI